MGLPTDWDFINPDEAIDVLLLSSPDQGMERWVARFNQHVASHSVKASLLVGYSMGARLAMQALLARPALFKGAVFISGHTGLSSEKARALRRQGDQLWAQRFLAEPWEELIEAWNQQPVFRQTSAPIRNEACFSRELLADALCHFSLGLQADLREALSACPVPQLFLRGAEDPTNQSIETQRLIPRAGHRLLSDCPEELANHIKEFALRVP